MLRTHINTRIIIIPKHILFAMRKQFFIRLIQPSERYHFSLLLVPNQAPNAQHSQLDMKVTEHELLLSDLARQLSQLHDSRLVRPARIRRSLPRP
ncbi:hypothetical protein Agabi119p4_10808 [Agaricus bisporus var. burnettii]|uniref:Uncharacterized protein n=1 Tax=Agaricus bisporus var. burnettii TaxID=192524 RepID=A0A8H7C0F0_AGABI|nr:hypothetical protein Agabi119p4_10808 [Agaricus bisporus var. burnettii]